MRGMAMLRGGLGFVAGAVQQRDGFGIAKQFKHSDVYSSPIFLQKRFEVQLAS